MTTDSTPTSSGSISPLTLTAKRVIDAAWLHGPAYDLASQAAFALESAQLLQSPDTAAELERLRTDQAATARVAELEKAAVEGRAALADLIRDHEDPGTAALGALYLLQQATFGTPMQPGETVPKVYRAAHDSIVMGLYTTAAEARRHCETEARQTEAGGAVFDWIEDEEDGVAELVADTVSGEEETGYTVTAVEVAAEYDPEADQ
ncbi:hypothetical protein [Streptomyces olivaceus]|uniref:hypothetical protein n=1 Tax=Streptomyces olivaceus TaxID=47716 RepID=UPI0022EF2911|nr:hypothetical protein [Streptomyces olivaceus]GHI91317.1 hypothetical protein TPA0905_07880 [Streptomyces olivaceus]